MLKVENVEILGWEHAIRGGRRAIAGVVIKIW